MARPIGYYVHHHGDGHRQRALSIADVVGERLTLLGTRLQGRTGAIEAIDLPDDRMPDADFAGRDGEADRPDALHYAPLDHEGVRARTAAMTGWIARARPALIVVDVSVEVAMLARLLATPTVYVRLAGRRDDQAHLDAFRGARALIAPFAGALDDPGIAPWVRAKTAFFPGITPNLPAGTDESDDVLVIAGAGGTAIDCDGLAAAARATPGRQWRIAGAMSAPTHMPSNLTMLGWTEDIGNEIGRAGVVVGGAGDGTVSAVLSAGKPFICVPEERPFGEQASKARQLGLVGAAVVRENWPVNGEWEGILAEARRLDGQTSARLHDPEGARRAAAFLLALADGLG